MRICSYCGKEYPDDVAVCVTDGYALTGAHEGRLKVTGVWRGVYGFGKSQELAGLRSIAFTLKLKQGWTRHFNGTVREDTPQTAQEIGSIDGYFTPPTIEFTKLMPIGNIRGKNGELMALREYILEAERACEKDLPSPPILYRGTFLDERRMQGIWLINRQRIRLVGGSSVFTPQTSGYWCAEFVSEDTESQPMLGPTEPLFDKALLSRRELEEVEGVAFCSIGTFSVGDANNCLEKFGQEGIRFKLIQNHDALQKTSPIMELTGGNAGTAPLVEIFVHPDDELKAVEIVGWCVKIG